MRTNKNAILRLAFALGFGLAGTGLMMPPISCAQDENGDISSVGTPEVELIGYRLPTPLSETSRGVSVITREQIDELNPATAGDLMRDLPGLYVTQLGGPGRQHPIRGSDSEQVLALIDGVRVNDPMLSRGGSYDF